MTTIPKIIALNGTNFWPMQYGRLEQFFRPDARVYFPYRSIWRIRDYEAAIGMIDSYVGENEPYDLIAFSRGATLAHLIAAYDTRVRLLVACSGLVPPGKFPIRPECRVLMTCNAGEKESMRMAPVELFPIYRSEGADVSFYTVEHSQWPAHRFGPAIPVIQAWRSWRFGSFFPFVSDSLSQRGKSCLS